MNEIILHWQNNINDARNPSSYFSYKQQAAKMCWDYIYKNIRWSREHSIVGVHINGVLYWAFSKESLFNSIKHHFGA